MVASEPYTARFRLIYVLHPSTLHQLVSIAAQDPSEEMISSVIDLAASQQLISNQPSRTVKRKICAFVPEKNSRQRSAAQWGVGLIEILLGLQTLIAWNLCSCSFNI